MNWLTLATAFGMGAFAVFVAMRLKVEALQAAHRAELAALRSGLAPPEAPPHHPV